MLFLTEDTEVTGEGFKLGESVVPTKAMFFTTEENEDNEKT